MKTLLIALGAVLFMATNVLIMNLAFEQEHCASKIIQLDKCE